MACTTQHDMYHSVRRTKGTKVLHVRLYKTAKKRFDEDEDFKRCSQLAVVGLQASKQQPFPISKLHTLIPKTCTLIRLWPFGLQSGDSESIKIWQLLCDISRKMFNQVRPRQIDRESQTGVRTRMPCTSVYVGHSCTDARHRCMIGCKSY